MDIGIIKNYALILILERMTPEDNSSKNEGERLRDWQMTSIRSHEIP